MNSGARRGSLGPMPRIDFAVPVTEGYDPDAALNDHVDAQVRAILEHRPAALKAYLEYRAALVSEGTLSPKLIELVRLRIAFHNQCRSCMAMRYQPDAISEGMVCSLEQPEEADDLTDAEKAALNFADLFVNNHFAIDDAVYDRLREHYDEGELVELGLHCAAMLGTGRLAATWAVVEGLPEDLRDAKTPWRSPAPAA